jgi:hypothetical protein
MMLMLAPQKKQGTTIQIHYPFVCHQGSKYPPYAYPIDNMPI